MNWTDRPNRLLEPPRVSVPRIVFFLGTISVLILSWFASRVLGNHIQGRAVVFSICVGQFLLVLVIWALTCSQARSQELLAAANTERERLHAAEKKMRVNLERTARIKNEFIATVSHELRAPLNIILGWVQLMKRSPLSEEYMEKGMNTIERNVRLEAQLIDDLLDMSRISSDKLKLHKEDSDIGSLLQEVTDIARENASAKGVTLKLEIEKGLQSFSFDRKRIRQVLFHLLCNAVKFSAPGGIISAKLRRRGSNIVVTVRDNGIGIAREFLPYLFDSFRQADATTTRRHGGLGLGLALCKEICEMHEGSITAESNGVGTGSTFTVTLPAPPSDSRTGAPPRTERDFANDLKLSLLEGKRVLIVDDDEGALDVTSRFLEDVRMEVYSAFSVNDALAKFPEIRPDIIVSDLSMPERDGYELARAVRLMHSDELKNTPLIALSAFSGAEDLAHSESAGFDAHVAKPVSYDHLVKVVYKVLYDPSRVQQLNIH